jgi:hypothetical protein
MPKQKKQILILKKMARVFGAKPASSTLRIYTLNYVFFITMQLLTHDSNTRMLSVSNYNEVLRKIPNFRKRLIPGHHLTIHL